MKAVLYLVGALFALAGAMYLLAAMGVEALDNLTDSAGGPWAQGIIAFGIGIALMVAASKREA